MAAVLRPVTMRVMVPTVAATTLIRTRRTTSLGASQLGEETLGDAVHDGVDDAALFVAPPLAHAEAAIVSTRLIAVRAFRPAIVAVVHSLVAPVIAAPMVAAAAQEPRDCLQVAVQLSHPVAIHGVLPVSKD